MIERENSDWKTVIENKYEYNRKYAEERNTLFLLCVMIKLKSGI